MQHQDEIEQSNNRKNANKHHKQLQASPFQEKSLSNKRLSDSTISSMMKGGKQTQIHTETERLDKPQSGREEAVESNDSPQIYKRASNLVFCLALISLGSSNVIGGVAIGDTSLIEPTSLVLVIIYSVTGFLIRRESIQAYRVAFAAFAISSVISLGINISNAQMINETIGDGAFIRIFIMNFLYVVVLCFIFFHWHRKLHETS